jgi:uncharacterized protein YlxW (UPF0749 family)
MNQVFSRLGSKNWLFHVTLMCFLLGALLAANLNTQGSMRQQLGLPAGAGRVPWLVEALKEQRDTNEKLKATIAELRAKTEEYEQELSQRSRESSSLNRELQEVKFLLGLTPARGPGVIVTLDDNKSKRVGDIDSDLYIVHDFDLRNVVNELWAAGAEAISINDHRIVARTAIRCVGPNAMINGEPTAAPFVIKAIGNPADLEGALNIPNGVVDLMRVGIKVKIERGQFIEVPAFTGATTVKYAKPVPLKQEGTN